MLDGIPVVPVKQLQWLPAWQGLSLCRLSVAMIVTLIVTLIVTPTAITANGPKTGIADVDHKLSHFFYNERSVFSHSKTYNKKQLCVVPFHVFTVKKKKKKKKRSGGSPVVSLEDICDVLSVDSFPLGAVTANSSFQTNQTVDCFC